MHHKKQMQSCMHASTLLLEACTRVRNTVLLGFSWWTDRTFQETVQRGGCFVHARYGPANVLLNFSWIRARIRRVQ